MLSTNDVSLVFDTILSTPGMNDAVKLDMKISRKNVLLLSSVIKKGLAAKEEFHLSKLFETLPKETLQELETIADDYIVKAGLSELNEKLRVLAS